MKIKYLIQISLIVLITLIGCNETKTVTEPEEAPDYSKEISEFFPANIGDSYTYSVDTLNQETGKFYTIGSRKVEVNKVENNADKNLYLCNEDYTIFGKNILTNSKFQITPTTLEFIADTNGVSALIPDSIEIEIKLMLDESFKLVEFPLTKNKEWKVFQGSANFGTFKFNIFDVKGEYIESEVLKTNTLGKEFNTEKFKYTININIPDIANPFLSNIQKYEAYVWFAPGFGVVKIEGSRIFVDPITGNGFDIADTNRIIRHTLTE